MSEKRGYPNPNYTEGDILNEEIAIDEIVIIPPDKYDQLCSKAAALDILKAYIMKTGKVDSDIAFAVTGTTDIKVHNKADDYYRWWCEARDERDELKEEVKKLKQQINELLPCMDDENSAEVSE